MPIDFRLTHTIRDLGFDCYDICLVEMTEKPFYDRFVAENKEIPNEN